MNIPFKKFRSYVIGASVSVSCAIIAFGCGSAYQTSNSPIGAVGSASSTGTTQPPLSDEPPPEVKSGARTASVVNYEAVLESMSMQTGQMPSTNTLNRFNNRIGMLSETGAVTTVNSSTLQAIAATAGDICSDLMGVEFNGATAPASLRFFNSIMNRAGSASSQYTSTVTADVVRRMARSFWQRNESTEELEMISTGMQEAITAEAGMSSRDMGLYLCTSMLSTVSAIEL